MSGELRRIGRRGGKEAWPRKTEELSDHHHDVVLSAERVDVRLLEVRVELELIHSRLDARDGKDAFEVLRSEI